MTTFEADHSPKSNAEISVCRVLPSLPHKFSCHGGKLCATKTKCLKFSKSEIGSNVSIQLAS
jgi:hypothetical protein